MSQRTLFNSVTAAEAGRRSGAARRARAQERADAAAAEGKRVEALTAALDSEDERLRTEAALALSGRETMPPAPAQPRRSSRPRESVVREAPDPRVQAAVERLTGRARANGAT